MMEMAFEDKDVTFQLVSPRQHRINAAERVIRTFKTHFLAGLDICQPQFPLREWGHVLPQAEMILNMLKISRVDPNLLLWVYLVEAMILTNHNWHLQVPTY